MNNVNFEKITKVLSFLYADTDTLKILGINQFEMSNLAKLFVFFGNYLFTASEVHIFILVARGFSNDSIAQKLFISKNTVRFHLKNIYIKTSLESRLALIKRGVELGL